MSGVRYAPVPTSSQAQDAERELEEAFDASDDEDDAVETQPMIPTTPRPELPTTTPTFTNAAPATYDFEYDYSLRPPAGSPPEPSSFAYPDNIFGNTNGELPASPVYPASSSSTWYSKALRVVLPGRLTRRGADQAVGGGQINDGVFANVVAKPIAPSQVQQATNSGTSTSIHVVPEDEQKDAPPSYAAAQADAVPPYWETTIHAPGLGGDLLLVEGIPAGSVFSFLVNFFISMSFQFVGFMLTSILATTHAARYGSRAGLGFTLVQYGFYLRQKDDTLPQAWMVPDASPSLPSESVTPDSVETGNSGSTQGSNYSSSDELQAATDWLSFFLMTIGWLLFLSSAMAYWRVKRWETGIRQSSTPGARVSPEQDNAVYNNLQRNFGFVMVDPHTDLSRPSSPEDPEVRRRMEAAIREDQRLQADLRAAGLI